MKRPGELSEAEDAQRALGPRRQGVSPLVTPRCSAGMKRHQTTVSRVFVGVSLGAPAARMGDRTATLRPQAPSALQRSACRRLRPGSSHRGGRPRDYKLRCDPRGPWVAQALQWLGTLRGLGVPPGSQSSSLPHDAVLD